MPDVIAIIILIIALISTLAFNSGNPAPTPEWNPIDTFSIGAWLLAYFIYVVVGLITGYSKGMWFDSAHTSHESQDFNSLTYEQRVELGRARNARVKAGLMVPAIVLLVIVFIASFFRVAF